MPHRLNQVGNLFSIFFTADPVTDYESARRQDVASFARFFHAMLEAGVWLPPSAYEAWFCSTAIDASELAVIEQALREAAAITARV